MDCPHAEDEWPLFKWAREVNDRITQLEEAQKPDISVKIENESGDMSFVAKILRLRERHTGSADTGLWIVNKNSCVELDTPQPTSSSGTTWGISSWSTLLLAAGAVYWYRHELRILGRGIVAGVNLTIERFEDIQELGRRHGRPRNTNVRARWPTDAQSVKELGESLHLLIEKKRKEGDEGATKNETENEGVYFDSPLSESMRRPQQPVSSSEEDFELPPPFAPVTHLDGDVGPKICSDKGKGKQKATVTPLPRWTNEVVIAGPSRPPPPSWYNPEPTPMSPIPEASELENMQRLISEFRARFPGRSS